MVERATSRAGGRAPRGLALLLAAPLAWGCYQSPASLTDDGEAALRAYHLDEAEAAFTAALDKDPTLPRALYGLGWIYFSRGDNPRARVFFERCLQMDPTYYGCHRGMGSLHLNMGFYTQAEQSLQQALALEPGEPSVLSSLGQLYLATERYDDARKVFEQAQAQESDRGEIYFGLAELAFRQGKVDEALALLDKAEALPIVEVKFTELIHELRSRLYAARALEVMKGRGDPVPEPFATEARELYGRAVVEIDAALETAVLQEKHRLWRFRKRMVAEQERLAEGRLRVER